MIHCLLVKVGCNQRGLPIRIEQSIEGEALSIGRSAECDIHLPDHRISLKHAYIRYTDDGQLHIVSEQAQLNIDGAFVQSALLVAGMRILIGGYQLIIESIDSSSQFTLAFELLPAPSDEPEILKDWQPAFFRRRWVSQRIVAWLLMSIVLLACLILPVMQSTNPAVTHILTEMHVNPHQIWNTGSLSNAHRLSNASCLDCHSAPFKRVSNQACLQCHTPTADHGMHDAAHANITKKMYCTQCHSEHEGGKTMAFQGEGQCVLCHGTIKHRFPNAQLSNIHDFSRDHPNFKLSVLATLDASEVMRVLQMPEGIAPASSSAPQSISQIEEHSGLKFPHDQHVGKVQVPGHMWEIKVMQCANCHQADAAGTGFKPIDFKQHCFSCHQDKLTFEPDVLGRSLPHSSMPGLSNALHDEAASLALKEHKTADWVNSYVAKAGLSLSSDEACGYCHFTKPTTDLQKLFEVSSVNINQHWFPQAKFSHQSHTTFNCAKCHDVEHSDNSANIAMPNRQTCLQCHGGMNPASDKVQSTCISCHIFHSGIEQAP